MCASYESPTPPQGPILSQGPMVRFAHQLSGSRLGSLVLMSDPARTPDLLELAAYMPSGSAIIYRHFGKPGLERRLRAITEGRGVQLLIGNDPELAITCGADGVHFPRTTPGRVLEHWRDVKPDWIISTAAAKEGPDLRPLDTLDALFVSSIFPSASPSAGTPIGVEALQSLTTASPCPVFALGGITGTTVSQLHGTGIAGIAAISGLAEEIRIFIMSSSTKADGHVTISKTENGDRIVFTADVAGSSATGELTMRRVADGVWNANHTGVPKEIGGRGVGKALVKAMVEDARLQGYRVVPGCPFVAKLFERKPDWADGVAA